MKILVALILAILCAFPSGVSRANPQTRDTWRSVRTNNLFVIGNADPEKLRQVATWLEFFHGAFGRLVSRTVIDSSVPTTVILFRDDASFQPFKPLYQGRTANVAGYFQPGDDVNYIAISLDPSDGNPFSTAFHEYVHAHVNENIPGAPLWLNEGLAEFYGSLQFSGGEAVLGTPLMHYIRYLRQQELLPLNTLFSINTSSEHYNESEKTGVFYGQSWALVHYLMLGDRGRQDQFKRFLSLIARGDSSAKAIEDAFGVTIPALEQELRAYVRGGQFPTLRVSSIDNPEAYAAYTAMQRTSLSEGEANYYLGDLLMHSGRSSDAERYFKHAVALDPNLAPAQAALGQLYVQQRRYPEAKKSLEKAVSSSSQSYLTHYYYAYVLSREGVSSTGRIKEYTPATAALMREHLLRAIKLAPNYAPAYYYLGLINLVTGERLDEAIEMAQRAKQLEPSQTASSLLLAQIYLRRSDNAAARRILEPLTRDSNKSVRDEAQDLLASIDGSSGSKPSTSAPTVSSAMISEPSRPSTGRIFGGEPGGVAINDGQTIDRSGSLPAVDEVLNKYIAAMGGAAAMNAVNSRVMKGSLDVPGISRGGTFESYAQAPNKILTVMQAYPVGTIKFAYDGNKGWALTSRGVRTLKGTELNAVLREADFYGPLNLKTTYKKVTLAGMSKIGYREMYVIDLQPTTGVADRLYLDAKTYLPARMNTQETIGAFSGAVEVYLDDWREVDGLKYPFSISQRSPKLTLSFTIKEIKHNVPIDAKIFDPIP